MLCHCIYVSLCLTNINEKIRNVTTGIKRYLYGKGHCYGPLLPTHYIDDDNDVLGSYDYFENKWMHVISF